MTENIKELIIKNKPNISKSSVTTYLSILKNLYINVFKDDKFDLKNFENADKILHCLKDLEPNKRKTILASLVVITDNKKYREIIEQIKKAGSMSKISNLHISGHNDKIGKIITLGTNWHGYFDKKNEQQKKYMEAYIYDKEIEERKTI